MTDEAMNAVGITVTRMAAGSEVPEWLIAMEPNNPNAVRGAIRFGIDMNLIELPDMYVLVPCSIWQAPGAQAIYMGGGQGMNTFAPGKPVRVVLSMIQICTLDDPSWNRGTVQQYAADVQQQYAQQAAMQRGYEQATHEEFHRQPMNQAANEAYARKHWDEATRKSFWGRLRDLFS